MISVQSFRDLGLFLHKILGFSQDLMGEVSQLNHSQEHHFVSLTHAVSQLQKDMSLFKQRLPPHDSESPPAVISEPEQTAAEPAIRDSDISIQNIETKVRMLENMIQSLKTANKILSEDNIALKEKYKEELKAQQLYYQSELEKREQQIQKLKQQLPLAHHVRPESASQITRLYAANSERPALHPPQIATGIRLPGWHQLKLNYLKLNYLRESADSLSPQAKISVTYQSQLKLLDHPDAEIFFEEDSSNQYQYLLFQSDHSPLYIALPKKMIFNAQKMEEMALSRLYHVTGQGHIQDIGLPAVLEKHAGNFTIIQQGRLTLA